MSLSMLSNMYKALSENHARTGYETSKRMAVGYLHTDNKIIGLALLKHRGRILQIVLQTENLNFK
jgi:hypothetical protein